jgi:hypothetical protein
MPALNNINAPDLQARESAPGDIAANLPSGKAPSYTWEKQQKLADAAIAGISSPLVSGRAR